MHLLDVGRPLLLGIGGGFDARKTSFTQLPDTFRDPLDILLDAAGGVTQRSGVRNNFV